MFSIQEIPLSIIESDNMIKNICEDDVAWHHSNDQRTKDENMDNEAAIVD